MQHQSQSLSFGQCLNELANFIVSRCHTKEDYNNNNTVNTRWIAHGFLTKNFPI